MTPPPTPEERAAFREFVRTHHPDRGGDPEAFAAGLARFRAAQGDREPGHPEPRDDPRREAPAEVVGSEVVGSEVVGPLPLPVRVGVALIRTWKRRRGGRVE